MADKNTQPLLEVHNLKTYFFTEDGVVKAVDGIDFYVAPGEILGLVGESGCGKSVTSLSIMRLVGIPGKIVEGKVTFEGRNLLELSEAEMVDMRGNRMSMIFQQPQSSLNPVFKVGDQVAEVLQIHRDMGKEEAWEKSVELLRLVGIPDPERKAHAFPHEMSGGQAQRVMIAMALALNPQLLIADEPTTALDVTIQAQILDLMRDLSERMGTSVILITHDLGVIAEMADRVAVIEAGRIVEQGRVLDVFTRPQQAITKSLIDEILPQELPASVLDHVRKLAGQLGAGRTGQLLRLSYAGDSAYQPILSQLIRQFGVDMSILHGQVDEIQDETFGSLAVYASGEADSVRGAVAHLRAGGVEVEEVAVAG